jgi:hypothetical protein
MSFASALAIHQPTLPYYIALSKVALYVCLMATAYGIRYLGSAIPSHYERLKRYAQLARKRSRVQQEKAEMELPMAAVKYTFSQEVTPYYRESGEVRTEANATGGWTVSPHWRRVHWRFEVCRLGRQERRRVVIPSVLVNAHLFLGAPGDTQAAHRMQQG